MKKAYIRRALFDPEQPAAIGSSAPDPSPVPPTAAEFLGWPNTRHPWLRLAFIHDALARNQDLPPDKRWRVTSIDVAAALRVEQDCIKDDVAFLRDEIGVPIITNTALGTYEYSEKVPAAFVDLVGLARQRKASSAPRGQEPPPGPALKVNKHYQKRKVQRTPFERMVHIREVLKEGQALTGSQLAIKTKSSVTLVNWDISYMRLRLGLPISFRPELGAFAFTAPVAHDEREMPQLVTAEQLATALNLPRVRTVHNLRTKKRIPFIKLGASTIRYCVSDCIEALKGSRWEKHFPEATS